MFNGVVSYSVLSYLYVSINGLITSVREERANYSEIDNLQSCGFGLEGFPLSLGAREMAVLFHCDTPCAFHIIIPCAK